MRVQQQYVAPAVRQKRRSLSRFPVIDMLPTSAP